MLQGIVGGRSAAAVGTCGSFAHCYPLTYDHTKTGTADSSSFAALLYFSAAAMKDTSHGGDVNSTTGDDILVFSDSGYTTQIASEKEFYDNVNGVGWFWVNIGTLSHSADGIIYVGVGRASPPSRTTGVWDSNFVGAWHLPNGTTLGAADSSSSANNGTIHTGTGSPTAVSGQIDGGAAFLTSNAGYIYGSLASTVSLPVTISGWLNLTSGGQTYANFFGVDDGSTNGGYRINMDSAGSKVVLTFGAVAEYSFSTLSAVSTSTWYYYAATISGNAGTASMYRGAAGALTSQTGVTVGTPTGALGVWNLATSGVRNINNIPAGTLDEWHLSKSVRSASWITAEYNNQYAPGNIGSAGFWTWGTRQ
jgi:hypothetical protein